MVVAVVGVAVEGGQELRVVQIGEIHHSQTRIAGVEPSSIAAYVAVVDVAHVVELQEQFGLLGVGEVHDFKGVLVGAAQVGAGGRLVHPHVV